MKTEQRKVIVNDPLQYAAHTDDWSLTEKAPDPKCKECYGTGRWGYDVGLNRYVICECVRKQ